jgi:hypothetical protein
MTTVRLGNTCPHQGVLDDDGNHVLDENGQKVYEPIELDALTEVLAIPSAADTLLEQLRAFDDLWKAHSSAPPSWVWSDDAVLESVLAAHFGCEAGLPDDVEETHYTHSGPPGVGVGWHGEVPVHVPEEG